MPIRRPRPENAAPFTYASDNCLNHAVDGKLVGHRHIARREAQLDIVQAIARGIFHVFVRHAATSFQRGQDFHPPVELSEKTDQIRFEAGDLDVGTQRFKGGSGKGNIKLAAKIEDGLGPDVTVKVAVNVG